MKARRLLLQSLRSLARYRARSAFMMLGSLVGIAALVFAVSVGQAVQGAVLKTAARHHARAA